ncbi:hypothetical protein COV11_03325 [Candidatus Woesearchaeota archaeon CG10_big_fil_rev_8_21_14_0_10_30_7]|nr:MAG: hypothetical protein COV11_03325 [Candidatus Woesearchaeota archaeon CG10_big_fil_rev_8_21_14_0_10_30_7]
MTKTYLKSYNMPYIWEGVLRKKEKYILKPNPGSYGKEFVIPLGIVIKLLRLAKTTKEVKNILQNKNVLVNKKKVNDVKYALGFTDVLDINGLVYRVVLNEKGRLNFVQIDKDQNLKPAKVIGKTILKKEKVQLNLNDSRNLIVNEGKYNVGDTIVLELPKQNIKEVIELKKGTNIIITKGKRTGDKGVVKEIKEKQLIYTNKENKDVKTLKDYVFALPKILQ